MGILTVLWEKWVEFRRDFYKITVAAMIGPLMYLTYFAVNGAWQGFFAMWVAGIPFDLAHCGSNFVFTLVLYRPLYRVMVKFLGAPAAHQAQISEEA